MTEISGLVMLILIIFSIVFLWMLYKLINVASKILDKLTAVDEKVAQKLISIDNIEYALTGTSKIQKSIQDHIRNNFSSNGEMRSDKTSLRDFLENHKYEHQEIKIIGVELKWLRKQWEYKNISSTTRVEDRVFRDLALNFHYEWLRARGVTGESLKNEMEKYYKIDQMLDKKSNKDEIENESFDEFWRKNKNLNDADNLK
jgi:hypothetical protein